MTRMQLTALTTLIDSADGGGYTLPTELLDTWRTYTRVRALEPPSTDVLAADTAAARLVSAVAAAKPVDLPDYGRQMLDADTERTAAGKSLEVLRLAVDQAGTAAVNLAADLTERIITDHLRPALDEVHDQAREVAKALESYGLDPHRLLSAPAKARKAYAELPALLSRRGAIFNARKLANAVGYRTPQHDAERLYSEFRYPLALSDWKPPARIPMVNAPSDPAERLLWVVSDAAAALGPWLPTVSEQDAAWWEQFGEGIQMRAQAHRNGQAIGARIG